MNAVQIFVRFANFSYVNVVPYTNTSRDLKFCPEMCFYSIYKLRNALSKFSYLKTLFSITAVQPEDQNAK